MKFLALLPVFGLGLTTQSLAPNYTAVYRTESKPQLSSRVLVWNQGADFETKTIDLTFSEDYPGYVENAVPLQANRFSVCVKEIVPRRLYRLHVTPLKTHRPGITLIQVNSTYPAGPVITLATAWIKDTTLPAPP
jgi:hypothetical protein